MNRTYEEWLKYYENATKEQVIEDMMLDNKEIERLTNIINELEKYLKENSKQSELFECDRNYKSVLKKLQELKEGKQ